MWSLLLLLLSSFSCAALASSGPGISGGGDDIGLEFLHAFNRAEQVIDRTGTTEFASARSAHLPAVAQTAKILVVETPLWVTLDGVTQSSVAINDPATQTILINRTRWSEISNVHFKEGIALHEILSLAGLESTGRYPLSSLYISKFNISPTLLSPTPALNLVNSENKASIQNCSANSTLQNPDQTGSTLNSNNSTSVEIVWKDENIFYRMTLLTDHEPGGYNFPFIDLSRDEVTLDSKSNTLLHHAQVVVLELSNGDSGELLRAPMTKDLSDRYISSNELIRTDLESDPLKKAADMDIVTRLLPTGETLHTATSVAPQDPASTGRVALSNATTCLSRNIALTQIQYDDSFLRQAQPHVASFTAIYQKVLQARQNLASCLEHSTFPGCANLQRELDATITLREATWANLFVNTRSR